MQSGTQSGTQAGLDRAAVVGAGQMGSGIAQVAASAGYEVVLVDVAESFLERGLAAIRRSLGKFLEKGKITQEAHDEALGRIRTSLSLEDLKDADLIVEAIVEDEGEKRRLFERLGALAKPEAILASNTSSIPITALARYSGRPERFIGMHFFNPVPLMKVVEVIAGLKTDPAVCQRLNEFARQMGHTPVQAQDTPGFIVNHAGRGYGTEALRIVSEGIADFATIDAQTFRILTPSVPEISALRVIGATPASPGMTFITGLENDPELLREAIGAAIAGLDGADTAILGLRGIVVLPDGAYDPELPPPPASWAK